MPQSHFSKIRARAPLRIGLAGGGTDISPFCDQHGGAVLNVTIDRFAFASCISRTDGRIMFEADDLGVHEEWNGNGVDTMRLKLHRGVYKRMMEDFNNGEYLPLTLRTTVD